MKNLYYIIIIFISLGSSAISEIAIDTLNQIKEGNKLIFIRHAYAPGEGDPKFFNINDCLTQRNLSKEGKNQAKNIGNFFINNQIDYEKVYSSEWCRCKDTAFIVFKNFETKNFLNSFYEQKFSKNKKNQIKNLKKFVENSKSSKNIILITHFVVISEALNFFPESGEIVISDKKFNEIDSYKIEY